MDLDKISPPAFENNCWRDVERFGETEVMRRKSSMPFSSSPSSHDLGEKMWIAHLVHQLPRFLDCLTLDDEPDDNDDDIN